MSHKDVQEGVESIVTSPFHAFTSISCEQQRIPFRDFLKEDQGTKDWISGVAEIDLALWLSQARERDFRAGAACETESPFGRQDASRGISGRMAVV